MSRNYFRRIIFIIVYEYERCKHILQTNKNQHQQGLGLGAKHSLSRNIFRESKNVEISLSGGINRPISLFFLVLANPFCYWISFLFSFDGQALAHRCLHKLIKWVFSAVILFITKAWKVLEHGSDD